MSTNRSFRRRPRRRNNGFRGNKFELIRKPIPRITTINKKVKKITDMIELKRADSFFNATLTGDGTDILLMNALAGGTGAGQRIGNEVKATSLKIRADITTDADVLEDSHVRILVFWDKQANDANPVTTTFTSTSGALLDGGIITITTLMPYNYATIDRYRILMDKMIVLNPRVITQTTLAGSVTTTDTVAPVGTFFKKKIKLNRIVKYDGAGGTIADIQTNSLFMVAYTDSTGVILRFGSRFYFKDA